MDQAIRVYSAASPRRASGPGTKPVLLHLRAAAGMNVTARQADVSGCPLPRSNEFGVSLGAEQILPDGGEVLQPPVGLLRPAVNAGLPPRERLALEHRRRAGDLI